jgi:hypothetical protein
MARVWTNGNGLSLSAANLNALEDDVAIGLSREPALPSGTSAQYLRGDKTMQTLNKAAVGLGSVDNTADSAKPVSTAQAAAIDAAKKQYPEARGTGQVTVGRARVTPGIDTRYSGFPVQTKLNDGRILMVWGESTDHATTRDGIVVGSYSSDNGLTWGAKVTLQTQSGIDLRDPTVSTTTDGASVFLTYTKATATEPMDGFFVRQSSNNGSTWGPEVQIDVAGSNGFGCSPIVQMANGTLLAVWYGRATGDAYDSCFRATSTDNGATWTNRTKFRDGVADSRHYNEPYATKWGNNVVIMYRHGVDDQLGITRSADNAATWSTPAAAFVGTGRPSCTITTKGTLIVVFREKTAVTANQHAIMRTSPDLGVTWTAYRMVERADPYWMLYSCPTEIAPGVIMCSTAIEHTTTSATLSVRYLLEGGAISPLGDVVPSLEQRAIERLNKIAVVDSFDRADTVAPNIGRSENGQKWTSPNPGPRILDGALDWTGSTGPYATVSRVLTPHMEVEAELLWTGVSGVCLLARYQDDSNYLMAALETDGTALRLYKVVAGVTTQIGATITVSAPTGIFHKVKLTCVGNNLRMYFEDDLVLTASDSAHNTQEYAGVRLGVSGTTATHRVQNFVARRRAGRLS